MAPHSSPRTLDVRAGLETALHGLSTSIGPILILVGLLGSAALPAGYWAALVAASAVPLVRLALGGHTALLPAPRAASLTTYATLVYQLCVASAGAAAPGTAQGLTPVQLAAGLASGALLYFAASALVLLAGVLRLGPVFKMIPSPVSAGIGNGTAMLLAWLALQQLWKEHAFACVTALGMLGTYVLWLRLQGRTAWAQALPAVVVAAGVGIALALALEPQQVPTMAALPTDAHHLIALWQGLEGGLANLPHLLRIALPGTLTLALVMILETFTAAALMEGRFHLRTDGNRELMALGCANMVSALLGGVPCTTSPVFSLSNRRAGGRGKLAVFVTFLVVLAALCLAAPWLIALPIGLGAGLLLLQCGPLIDPVFRGQLAKLLGDRTTRAAQASDLGFQITAVISLIGFWGDLIWACLVGIGLSSLAVLKRVSSDLTAQWVYLDSRRSRRVRETDALAQLSQQAHAVGILQLTGHLFFGNSTRLQQLASELNAQATSVALDLSQVHAVDPSGVAAVRSLVHTLLADQRHVFICGLPNTLAQDLRTGLEAIQGVEYHTDLDRCLEVCENRVLDQAGIAYGRQTQPVAHNHLLQELTEQEMQGILALGQRCEVAQGHALFERGSTANGIWLIVSGQVSILSDLHHDAARLATLGPGQFVGEMGLIDGQARSASARADSAVSAWLLDRDAIATLMVQHPAAALKITRNIARELSLRLRSVAH